jgi:hypothetical protein
MSIFDSLDSQLNQAQRDVFGVDMLVDGKPVIAIEDEVPAMMGEMQTIQKVWAVKATDLPPGFARGTQVTVNGLLYQVSRIFPLDGENRIFEIEA